MIYLDSAATTLQKPPAVARATARAMGTMASLGRGGHKPGMRAAETAFQCRTLAADLFHVGDPERVILTFNATHGLNIAIRSLVRPGSTVLISGYEHNAVTRPLKAIPNVELRVATAPVFDREGILNAFARELDLGADVVICNHVSNVFGFILPVEDLAALCAQRSVPFILDASQSAGVLPVHLDELKAAFIAMPGHKGLYGPQGTGLLLCGRDSPEPVLFGGTGSVSALQEMPDFLPDRLEAGTHNVCGVAGLAEGLRFVSRTGLDRIRTHEWRLNQRLMAGLERLPDVQVFRGDESSQSGLCSFVAQRMDSEVLGEELARRGVAVRAGLHCAPLAHRSAGTEESGTVRLSFSAFNRPWEVDQTLSVLKNILS
jgi:cysteine desulfurase family protein